MTLERNQLLNIVDASAVSSNNKMKFWLENVLIKRVISTFIFRVIEHVIDYFSDKVFIMKEIWYWRETKNVLKND